MRLLIVQTACAAAVMLVLIGEIHAQTQAAMNAQARADFARADAELNKTYQALFPKLRDTESKQKLKETQRAWITSRDAEAARAADEAGGGSMAPTIRYEAMTHLTRQRIKDLKTMLDNGTVNARKASASSTAAPSASPPESQSEQSVSQTGQAAAQTPSFTSPDKKWEYRDGDRKLFHAGTNEVALEFSCSLGGTAPLWAPDSKRFALGCSGGKGSETSVYQQRDNQWEQLGESLGNGDELMERAGNIIEAQAKRKGLPKKTFLHMNRWTVEPEQWLDSSTLIVQASMLETVHSRDGGYEGLDFGTGLLFTLRFDEAGKWKIVKTHEMTGKAAESPSRSAPLADKILYRSPQGNYRVQASVDGSALWIVPAKDPSRRKPLLGADPDDRSPQEFSASPDENWLFDNRQHELYRNKGDLAFSVFNSRQWLWKHCLDYASKEFHFARRDVAGSSAGWSFDSARLLIKIQATPQDNFEATPQDRFAYFTTRTKSFEQTPYLRMVNTKLHSEKPYQAFPKVRFEGDYIDSYVVFAEPIDSPPSEAVLKSRFTALAQEMNTLRGKPLADPGTRKDSSIGEFGRSQNDEWNKARDEAVQLYLPFAPDAEKESRKLQFLCDVTQREVNGLKELAPSTASDKPVAQSPSPAASPP